MYRLLTFFLIALILPAQTPPSNPTHIPPPAQATSEAPNQSLDKPPQDVDDALRARIKQFYDYHLAGKYRQAEQPIAEESKDDFYALSKPELHGYKIGKIEYSENFTKAKVVISARCRFCLRGPAERLWICRSLATGKWKTASGAGTTTGKP